MRVHKRITELAFIENNIYRAIYNNSKRIDYYPLDNGTWGVKAGKAYYLSNISIPASYEGKAVTKILPNAFEGDLNLTSITIPSSITEIGAQAFQGCANLEALSIPASVTTIGEKAFRDCMGLTTISVANGNAAFSVNAGKLIHTATNRLVAAIAGTVAYSITVDPYVGIGEEKTVTVTSEYLTSDDFTYYVSDERTVSLIGNSYQGIKEGSFILYATFNGDTSSFEVAVRNVRYINYHLNGGSSNELPDRVYDGNLFERHE